MRKPLVCLALLGSVAACEASHSHDEEAPNLTVTISGEGSALTGFAYPPTSPNDLAFTDGWEVRFDRILVTVDDIVLSDDPDTSATDQSLVGRVVARAKGPWAVDMTKPSVTDIKPRGQAGGLSTLDLGHDHGAGAGKDPHAQPLARFDGLDDKSGFDPARRYAFGFDIVPANSAAKLTNLDAAAQADYAEMSAKGLSVLYVGTATFKGVDCKWSDPSYAQYESAIPKVVKFRLGFTSPTTYKNCQNTDLRGKPFDGEEAQRGVQVGEHGGTLAQITLHVDHPFWSTVDHDAAELFFDQMAVAASADGDLTLDDLTKQDLTSFKDAAGRPLPWRSCMANKPVKQGTRKFDSGSVSVDPTAAADRALRSYADYVTYQQSTQGHLNADGLCAVERRFAAPR